jgi:hypothetical protein
MVEYSMFTSRGNARCRMKNKMMGKRREARNIFEPRTNIFFHLDCTAAKLAD